MNHPAPGLNVSPASSQAQGQGLGLGVVGEKMLGEGGWKSIQTIPASCQVPDSDGPPPLAHAPPPPAGPPPHAGRRPLAGLPHRSGTTEKAWQRNPHAGYKAQTMKDHFSAKGEASFRAVGDSPDLR